MLVCVVALFRRNDRSLVLGAVVLNVVAMAHYAIEVLVFHQINPYVCLISRFSSLRLVCAALTVSRSLVLPVFKQNGCDCDRAVGGCIIRRFITEM